MLGDAASMLVDASTYLFNLYAVSCADKKGRLADGVRLFAPAVSALVLSGITVWIMVSAVQELAAPASPVNTALMLLFGSINLAIDGANLAAFAAFPDAYRALLRVTMAAHEHDLRDYRGAHAAARGTLNMRSALTHVLADTFRSFAIIAAALTADYSAVSASHADAVAALTVALPIVVMAALLFSTIVHVGAHHAEGTDKEGDAAADTTAPYHEMIPPPPCLSAIPVSPKY